MHVLIANEVKVIVRQLVQLLLKHGANPLLANKHGERPLDLSENEAITELMKSEVLVSDDSEDDNAIAAAAAVDDDTGFLGLVENSWKDRSAELIICCCYWQEFNARPENQNVVYSIHQSQVYIPLNVSLVPC